VKRQRRLERVSAGELRRFLVSTRRGRVVASLYLAVAALLGVLLGVFHASDAVLMSAVAAQAVIAVLVIGRQAAKEAPFREDGQR
jgi:hypothetical protein